MFTTKQYENNCQKIIDSISEKYYTTKIEFTGGEGRAYRGILGESLLEDIVNATNTHLFPDNELFYTTAKSAKHKEMPLMINGSEFGLDLHLYVRNTPLWPRPVAIFECKGSYIDVSQFERFFNTQSYIKQAYPFTKSYIFSMCKSIGEGPGTKYDAFLRTILKHDGEFYMSDDRRSKDCYPKIDTGLVKFFINTLYVDILKFTSYTLTEIQEKELEIKNQYKIISNHENLIRLLSDHDNKLSITTNLTKA